MKNDCICMCRRCWIVWSIFREILFFDSNFQQAESCSGFVCRFPRQHPLSSHYSICTPHRSLWSPLAWKDKCFCPDLRQSGPREFSEASSRAGGADTPPSEPHLILKSFCVLHLSFCLFIWSHLILLTTDCVDVVQISRS